MKILTRYILKEMIGPTLLGFAFYTSIILMQRLFDMAGLIIRRSLSGTIVLKLLALSLPHIVVLTVPMSLLFGVLIAVGRLSSDSEIIAMRALGMSTRMIYRPVFIFSFTMFLVNAYLINVVLPRGNSALRGLTAELFAVSAEKDVKPRQFYDEYENLMIYVDDVDRGTGQWRGVFVSDNRSGAAAEGGTTPADVVAQNKETTGPGALTGRGGGQRIVVAEAGNLSVLKSAGQVWMNLKTAETHISDSAHPDKYERTTSGQQRMLLAETKNSSASQSLAMARSLRELNLNELLAQSQKLKSYDERSYNLARVEIHKKFAIPFACIVFGILGLPLGITNRRGGRSSGFSLSLGIILVYYLMINNGEHLAEVGTVSPAVGMWTANVLLLTAGIYLLIRANRDAGAKSNEGGGLIRRAFGAIAGVFAKRKERKAAAVTNVAEEPSLLNRLDITFPNILDRYILREFLKILGMVLVSVMALFLIVDYTEIARDVSDNGIAASTLVTYYRFYAFQVLHWTLPISVLVATLVTFGGLSKNNEVTALKSGGVSLYRVALPIIVVASLISVLAYLNLDFILPYATQKTARLKARIQGKTPVTATVQQQKLWMYGQGRYLINFLAYDHNREELTQVQVFEFHPTQFKLSRRVYADHAKWNGRAWEFRDGWVRSFPEGRESESTFTLITHPLALYYRETPEDFETEVTSPDQMTFAQLRRYIETIRNSGYAADELSVKLYSKTSWPAISLIMALIALPFAFKVGKRGALYGIGIALVLGIVYWMVFAVFTKFGEVGNLPALLSAWSANILFGLAAVYLFVNVET